MSKLHSLAGRMTRNGDVDVPFLLRAADDQYHTGMVFHPKHRLEGLKSRVMKCADMIRALSEKLRTWLGVIGSLKANAINKRSRL